MPNNHLPKDSYNRDAYLSNFRRTSLRLPNRDYSTGVYHIVTCAQGAGGRGPLFAHPALRQLLQVNWLDLPLRFPSIYLEALALMPDHIHFIVWMNKWPERLQGETAPKLSRVMQSYKSKAACEWIDYIKEHHPGQPAKIWQPGYIDRVIPFGEIDRVRLYIRANPDKNGQSAHAGWKSLYEHMGWEIPSKTR
jgi:putative transposase